MSDPDWIVDGRAITIVASNFWNAHYKPGDPNPVQIGVPQLGEFARLILALFPRPTIDREAIKEALFRLPGNRGGKAWDEDGFWPYFGRPVEGHEVVEGDDPHDVERITDAILEALDATGPTIPLAAVEAAYNAAYLDVAAHPSAVGFGRLDALSGLLPVGFGGRPITDAYGDQIWPDPTGSADV